MASNDDSRAFLDPATIAKIDGLEVRAKMVVEGFLAGMHKSPFFGQSVEFVQHREYVPGDDIRHLDWKVWSKSNKFYVKQYEAETTFRASLVVDTSESMLYGSGAMPKYDYACTAAACLAYMIVKQQDSAGLTSFGWDVKSVLPARSSQRHLNAITKTMKATRPTGPEKTDVFKSLRQVAESMPSRGVVVLFSDLLSEREPIFKGLEILRHRKHDVSVFHILDDDELKFPFSGMTKFEGMEELPELFCDPKALRDGYLEALEEYLTEVRRGCTRIGVDYNLIRTSDYLDAVLSRFLFKRMNDRAMPVKR